MSNTDGCSYVHDTSGNRFSDVEFDEWSCPHRPVDGHDYCVFHNSRESGTTAGAETLLAAIEDPDPALNRILGARMGDTDLDYRVFDGPTNHPVDLRESTFDGEFSFRHATVGQFVRFDGCRFCEETSFENSTFEARVDFAGARFLNRVFFRLTTFQSWADFRNAVFADDAYFRVARFETGIVGIDCRFEGAADFVNTRFDDVANFYRATFTRGAIFNSSQFDGNAQFTECTFRGDVKDMGSLLGNPAERDRSRPGTTLLFEGVTFERHLQLTGSETYGDIRVTDAHLRKDIECEGLVAPDMPAVVHLARSAVVSGPVGATNVTYDLTDATVGDLRLSAAGDRFIALRFRETTFDGFDFGEYKQSLAANNWRIHDPNETPEQAENTYLRAKNGAKAVGENRAAAEFFLREMRYRRAGHRVRVATSDGASDRLRAAAQWLANAAFDASCGYGERPSRTLASAIVVVVGFASLYAALDVTIPYRSSLGYLTFSIESFVALVLGTPETTSSLVSFVVALEGFSGGFLVALFVFSLTRSISR